MEVVDDSADAIVRNLFEHYLHDMAEWFRFDSKPDGAYHHPMEWVWGKYDVTLLYAGDIPVGFALIGNADNYLERAGVNDVSEFFVVRRHRRQGVGRAFANHLWNARPGAWLVRVLHANAPALPFWRRTVSDYSGGAFHEEARTVDDQPWSYFTFDSRSA